MSDRTKSHHREDTQIERTVVTPREKRQKRNVRVAQVIGIAFISVLILKLLNWFLRSRCTVEGSNPATLDPAKSKNLSCVIQRPLDVVANIDKRIISTVAYKTWRYDKSTGTLEKIPVA